MKKLLKITALALAALLIMCMVLPGVSAEKSKNEATSGYTIINPYENVDFDSIGRYKTGLHNHTNASDGSPTLKQSIERHVECGFDIVTVSDHGTVDYGWDEPHPNELIHGVLSLVGRSEGELEYLGKSGTFENGMSYELTEQNGDDYLVVDGDTKIMRVPYGIEQNAVSVNAHVCSWFTDYHNNSVTTYEDAIKNVDALGGVCVINHPGEYTKARYEIHSSDAYNTDNFNYWYFVNKFANLLNQYDRCIGIDMNSKGDDRTRFDRILWDKLLMRFAPNGKNIFAICSSDAHQLDKIDTGFVIALLPEMSSKALSNALLNGEFFGASHCIGNPDELTQIAASLKEFYGETELYNSVNSAATQMAEKVAKIDSGELDPDTHIGITYKVLDDEGCFSADTFPYIDNITIDSTAGTITIDSSDSLLVRWISDGELIATTRSDDATFCLADYSGKPGSYVRAEIFGEGGIIYTQPFIISGGTPSAVKIVDPGFFDFGVLDFLVAEFNNWFGVIFRFFKTI
ncbi:MAG: hypothetical protein J5562_05150 [Clostridia bacterium]|nr:hypothetical protein [Clostridia bacterium]